VLKKIKFCKIEAIKLTQKNVNPTISLYL